MSTATKQSQDGKDRAIAEWDSKKGNLAETPKNLHIMQQGLAGYLQKYGDFVSVEILNAIVKANAHQLDWLATPAPKATPAKPTGNRLWNKLVDAGVLPTKYSSVNDIQEDRKKADSKKQAHIDLATHLMERQRLLVERQEAASVTITDDKGRIRWSKTIPAREEAKRNIEAKIRQFNESVGDDLKISI